MALEFEKLTTDVDAMARSTFQRQQEQNVRLERALEKLFAHATDWERLNYCLQRAIDKASLKRLRAARPHDFSEPLDAAIDPVALPSQAIVIASDGSQIAPDRHAAFLYSLINVGIIVYFHGLDDSPMQFTLPVLDYPGKKREHALASDEQDFADSGSLVGLRRDRAEIESLAHSVWEYRHESQPILALLDQRLLYWPAIGAGEGDGSKEQVLQAWQEAMTAIRQSGGMLAGYIARSGKQSVITLLDALEIDQPGFDIARLTERDRASGLTDAGLFARILKPGQRSKVFVDVSQHNDDFRRHDTLNEVCFFYLNPGQTGRQIARVDVPRWVADDPSLVSAVQALIYDQCQILGDYPYVLARADEIAVVGRHDQENLDVMIANAMQRFGIASFVTAKQSSKTIARASRTRHEI